MKLAKNLETTWDLFSVEEMRWYQKHHADIKALARYCDAIGKRDVTIVPDDSEGEIVKGMRAVTFKRFDDDDTVVTVRTVFDVQYYHM